MFVIPPPYPRPYGEYQPLPNGMKQNRPLKGSLIHNPNELEKFQPPPLNELKSEFRSVFCCSDAVNLTSSFPLVLLHSASSSCLPLLNLATVMGPEPKEAILPEVTSVRFAIGPTTAFPSVTARVPEPSGLRSTR